MNGDNPLIKFAYLIKILQLEQEVRMMKALQMAEHELPIKTMKGPEDIWIYLPPHIDEILYQPPFPIILHKDPPRPPYAAADLKIMITAARAICEKGLMVLESLEAELDHQTAVTK